MNLCPKALQRVLLPSCFEVYDFLERVISEIPTGSKVLDAGAGQCQYKHLFAEHEYIAVDAAYGDENWDYSRLHLISDLATVPFPSDEFDAIICTQVLEHVKEPHLILKEAYRTLKPGGSLYISAPQGWGVHQAPHDYFRFTCFGLRHLFEKAGFRVAYIEPSCGYFGYLANRLTVFPKTVFWQVRVKWLRLILFPLELLSYIFFVLLFPLILNSMDPLDRKRDFTLNYFAKGIKPHA